MATQKVCGFPKTQDEGGAAQCLASSRKRQTPRKKRYYPPNKAKPGAIRLSALFAISDYRKISTLEISQELKIDKRTAKRSVQSDVDHGYITRNRTVYKSPNYKILLDGKNEYTLTEKGRIAVGRNQPKGEKPPQSITNSSKEEYAKSCDQEGSFCKLNHEDKQLLQKYGFTKLIPTAPKWWFKTPPPVEKSLKLLKRKKAKGYKCHCELKWLSAAIKREGVGFRRKVAEDTHAKLSGTLEVETPQEDEVLKQLNKLRPHGLDVSPLSLENLLRKGLSQLKSALTVLEKYLHWQKPIKSLNGMLSWIVGQKDPLELLKPIADSTEKQINKLKHFLIRNASHFTFSKPTTESAADKPHIELLIHSKSLNSSMVKLYKRINNEWRCLTLEVGATSSNFYEVVIMAIKRHFGVQFEGGQQPCH